MADFDDYCCAIDRHLHELLDDANQQKSQQQQQAESQESEYQPPHTFYVVHITEAEKMSDSGSSFIAYTIVFGDYEVRRRYSEFESLRSCLCRLYPTFIVPPIPEKHSLTQYAVLQKRAKEDQYIIERRKRLLERFLNHIAENPILSSEHVFHRFMENGVSWTEVLHSPVIKNIPSSPLHSSPSRAPGSSIADGTNVQLPKIAATNAFAGDVPVPSTLAPIKNIEPRWMDCELFTNKYANQFTGPVEKGERRIYRKLGELSNDYVELGAALNGFSLIDHPDGLAAAIERSGQAVDNSYIEISQLLHQMESELSEPIHEYSQYSHTIKQVLRFRLLKNLQVENVQEALLRQRDKLEGLLQADDEAKRLAHALESSSAAVGGSGGAARNDSSGAGGSESRAQNEAYHRQQHDAAEDDDLPRDGAQQNQHGFVTPQTANTDASSVHGSSGVGAVHVGGRSREPSVSSTAGGYHSEFTPTLAPRSIPRDSALAHSPNSQLQQSDSFRGRSRSGTANSGGSAGWAGRGSARPTGLSNELGTQTSDDEPAEDDPLAQFQQEESQRWGGGTRSTLPMLGSRARSKRNSFVGDHLAAGGSPAHMSRSEYIGQSSSKHHANDDMLSTISDTHDATRRAAGLNNSIGGIAASTPALRERHNGRVWHNDSHRHVNGQHVNTGSDAGTAAVDPVSGDGALLDRSRAGASSNASISSRLLRSPKALGDGIMNRLTYALNGMMDVDPEQLRRNQIGRASDKINILEEQLEMLNNDMVLINTSTQDNLDRFQKQKVRDIKGALVSMAKMHLEWAEKNLEIWKDAKEAVDQV
ncbi:Sorting nexin, cytoplasm-to-vacuole targeting pathway/endosomal sorting [Coemansia sp. RSA 1813]|nr:Sorting nexin, cytoplasm-to-vacuole targeting pathway/endosomal sorting [Coemansia sp. RSA 1646]KAJ1769560.1 Sorting nexin, cytoplasm-to-vacuole targeting pathway/endosomal sorting [Coemansia sp. RSA 1843]KAJ2085591.1 Sorting nexin, cytoplasm-to-vacuole targeting pathway/endosomal sorting [Coemansia sp. RSA 986]KAJ2210451.1 Sorting nexin, cytoplasm-to-vacuole targeting pathway/endosomal sorting [Coemansia sp. RSA 487]KAJ2562896.1 Sorting nexin, cytoplasm-to-vacuole targeting pathway/endosoma